MCGWRPNRAGAQLSASLNADAARATYDGYLASGAYTLTPGLSYVNGRGAAYADAALTKFVSGNTSEFGELGGSYTAGTGPLSFTARLDGSDSWYRSDKPVATGLGGLRAQLRLTPATGVWLGGSGGVSSAQLGGNDDVHGVGRGEAGAWVTVRPFTVLASFTGVSAGDFTYADVVATARLDVRHVLLSASAGTRSGYSGGGVRTWAEADAKIPLVATLSLVGAVGAAPTDVVRGLPGAHYISVGLHATFGMTTRPHPLLADVVRRRRTVEIREPRGSRVEVMGDFTDWRPVLCPEIAPGVFALAVPRAHGVYRIDVRVDGGPWTVPPGLTGVADDFGGEAGILVVP
jgi:hypothetical protein